MNTKTINNLFWYTFGATVEAALSHSMHWWEIGISAAVAASFFVWRAIREKQERPTAYANALVEAANMRAQIRKGIQDLRY